MASGLSIVVDTRNAEQSVKNLHQLLERLETQGNSVANMMRGLGGVSAFGGLSTSINQLKSDFNDLAKSTNIAKNTAKDLGDGLVYTKSSLTQATTAISLFQSAVKSLNSSLNTAQSALARFNQSGQSIVSMLNTINGTSGATRANQLNTAIGALTPNVSALNAQLRATNTALNNFATSATKAETSANKLNTALINNRTNMTGFASSTNGVGTALQRIGQSTASLQSQITGMGSSIVALNANLQTLINHSNNAGRGINTINTATNSSANGAKNADNAFSALSGTFSRLQALAAGGVFGVSFLSVLKTADAMQNLDNQVRIVTKSTEERLAVEAKVFDIANKNYMSLQTTTDIYHRNALAMAAMGASQKDVLRFTDNMSLAMRTSGRSITEQNSALYQWSQAMGAGKLQGQEFRIIALAVPSLLKYIAAEMGVSQGALKKLGSEGKISAEVMVKALEKARPELEKLASQMPMTMTQSSSIFKNRYDKFIDEMMNGTGGVSQKIAGVLQIVGNNFSAVANIAGGVAVVAMTRFAVSVTEATLASAGFNTANLIAIANAALANIAVKLQSLGLTNLTLATVRANIALGAYSLGMNTVMLATRGVLLAQNMLTMATQPLSVVFARATTAISAGAKALLEWSTTSTLAVAASKRLSGAMLVVAGSFIRVASIINANPLMFLATVLFSVVASTEGMEGAMKSLGDAVGVVGIILGNFIKMGVEGFVSLLDSTANFVSSLVNGTANGANKSNENLSIFFQGTQKGFVGILQGSATVFDAFLVTISTFTQKALNHITNLGIGAKNVYLGVKEFLGFGNSDRVAYEETDFTTLGSNSSFWSNGARSIVDMSIAQQEYTKATKASAGANVDLTKTIDPQAYAMYKQTKAMEEAEKARKALTKAQKEAARIQKETGNNFVSNMTLKGLPVKSREATSGGMITQATSEFAKITQSVLGGDLKYFSAFNDNYHQGKGGKHPKGMAFDIALTNAKKATEPQLMKSKRRLNDMAIL